VNDAPFSAELAQVREQEMLLAAKASEIDALQYIEAPQDA
jgi:hypothetical protein